MAKNGGMGMGMLISFAFDVLLIAIKIKGQNVVVCPMFINKLCFYLFSDSILFVLSSVRYIDRIIRVIWFGRHCGKSLCFLKMTTTRTTHIDN